VAAKRKPEPGTPPGRGRALLSPLIHGRVRLLILGHLLRARKAHTFTDVRNAVNLTDGTLSVHLSKLEEGGVVTIEKTFEGKKPRTLVRVTPTGRRMFKQYVEDLREVLPGL
jgi:DNA-binding HxlR family transcriptional regulator